MMQYRDLLLIVSPDMQETPALTRARELARKTAASLHLFLVDYSPAIANLRHIDESVMRLAVDNYMALRMRWLEGQVASLAKDGIKAGCSAVWGKPADEIIIQTVLEKNPGIVIKDVQSAKPVLRNIFTPLDWQLLRLCPVPLMLVNPKANPSPRRIIATVDPMEDDDNPHDLNEQILQTSRSLADHCSAEMHAIYAYPHPEIPAEPVAGVEPTQRIKVQREAHEAHLKAFQRLMDQHSVPEARRHFLEGKAIESSIGDFADQTDSDLIVLGTVYRSTIDRLMLGSTAERLLYQVDCDVLTLKPDRFLGNLRKAFKPDINHVLKYPPDAK